MKNTITNNYKYVLILLINFIFISTAKSGINDNILLSDTLTQDNAKHSIDSLEEVLKGRWEIVSYVFSDEPAMSEEVAKEWIGKEAIIDTQIQFNCKGITYYGQLFAELEKIRSFNIKKIILFDSDELYILARTDAKDLGIKEKVIQEIVTDEASVPLGSIILINRSKMTFMFDGTWFLMKRQK
jgi:hypothetical protein